MTFIRKSIAFARTAIASFFEADQHTSLSASDLDFYLFNREARMDEVLCQGLVGKLLIMKSGSTKTPCPNNGHCGAACALLTTAV